MLTSDIPLPPFDDAEAAARFGELVAYYAGRLDPSGGGRVGRTTMAAAIARHRPTPELVCDACGLPYPCGVLLSAAVTCRFPAPWTPATLAGSLARGGDPHWRDAVIEPGHLVWGDDPRLVAWRDAAGSWTVGRWDGQVGVNLAADFADDELCTWILADVRRFPLPEGVQVPAAWPPQLPTEAANILAPRRYPDLGNWVPGFDE